MSTENILITCESAPNIAVIKYWGKSNEELILPLNGSISITLDRNVLCTKTTLVLIKQTQSEEKKIRINLNGKIQEFNDDLNQNKENSDIINKKRFITMLNMVRNNCSLKDPYEFKLRIKSINNFPTACGLASSASGFACMAHCLAKAFGYKGDTSELARLGSGSACRSCFGGFVKWTSGDESSKSIASPIFPSDYWPEMNVLALVLEDGRKSVSSTNGMRDTVLTSELLKHRVKLVEEKRLSQMEDFIRNKDFNKFAKLVMQDSNNFHAVCMDTYPPLFYLNDKSKQIINFVNLFNQQIISESGLKVAYSFDAGPNCFLFVLDEYLNQVIYLIYRIYFSNERINDFVRNKILSSNNQIDLNFLSNEKRTELDKSILKENGGFIKTESDTIKYLIHSKVGQEPIIYEQTNDQRKSLLDIDGFDLA